MEGAAGPILDAGCGSLVFTAETYARTQAPVIAKAVALGAVGLGHIGELVKTKPRRQQARAPRGGLR